MRISDWSSDVCSSDLPDRSGCLLLLRSDLPGRAAELSSRRRRWYSGRNPLGLRHRTSARVAECPGPAAFKGLRRAGPQPAAAASPARSEEHTSELQSLMRLSYAVFCLKKKNKLKTHNSI